MDVEENEIEETKSRLEQANGSDRDDLIRDLESPTRRTHERQGIGRVISQMPPRRGSHMLEWQWRWPFNEIQSIGPDLLDKARVQLKCVGDAVVNLRASARGLGAATQTRWRWQTDTTLGRLSSTGYTLRQRHSSALSHQPRTYVAT